MLFYVEFLSQLDSIPKQSDILSLILRRKKDGSIRLKEEKKGCVDVKTRNQIDMCAKDFSITSMKGEEFSVHFNLLQQETIHGKWKVSLVHIFSWDRSNCSGEKEMVIQDVTTDGGK